MRALRSSVLIVMHPKPSTIAFGADFATDFEQALKAVTDFSYPVIALPSSEAIADKALAFLQHVNKASPLSQRVIIQNDTPEEALREIVNTGSIFRILPSFQDGNFDHSIQEALEEYRLLQQNAKLLQLMNEQNERLKRLTADLEERVEARRKSLEDAKEKLLVTNHRVEALHRALVAIHRAGSIAEMERLINEALSEALGLSWTRVLFQSQARLESQGAFSQNLVSLHSAPLTRGKEILGHIYFARGANAPFTRDENSFLGQIADAVSLAIDRLTKLEQSESLKHQWEATFDAILEPVSLVDSEYNVVRINKSFAERSGSHPEKVIGRKCYEALFGKSSPCDGCQIEELVKRRGSGAETGNASANFRLKSSKTAGGQSAIYEVFTQEIQFEPEERSLFVNMYRDVSAKLRFERQILETAKMAELGTIGSSIAHELNNPLGGMLSFLQLVKMDLKGDEPWYQDIDDMEKGARRCRDIVQSLLGFTRKSSQDTAEIVDLREVVHQALKITELQTRAMGITVVEDLPDSTVETRASFNFIAQAVRTFLQNAQESIADRIRSGDKTQGKILVQVKSDEQRHIIEVKDNGAGFDSTESGESVYDSSLNLNDASSARGLGLTVAQQIITDVGGTVEITSARGLGTTAKISLPRPVFDS